MTMAAKQQDDPDIHKGAIEGDRPRRAAPATRTATASTNQGMPDDPVATAEDEIGANEDDAGLKNADDLADRRFSRNSRPVAACAVLRAAHD